MEIITMYPMYYLGYLGGSLEKVIKTPVYNKKKRKVLINKSLQIVIYNRFDSLFQEAMENIIWPNEDKDDEITL